MVGSFKKKTDMNFSYSDEQLNSRKENIPALEGKIGSFKLNFDEEFFISFEKNTKPIPASIDYLAKKYRQIKGLSENKEKPKEYLDIKDVDFEQSMSVPLEPVKGFEKDFENFRKPIKEVVDDNFMEKFERVALADEADIKKLEMKHMHFYSLLSKIQEIHSASDFKSAYDIQDRISYLLNHKTLLYKTLVEHLLQYMENIIQKLEDYCKKISKKREKFQDYNKRISALKNYKYKTDESINILDENKEIAETELSKWKKK